MKIITILGSPRADGNTAILLDKFIAGARASDQEIEKIDLSKIQLNYCDECNGCYATSRCIIEDDINGIYDKLDQTDVIVLASPIFFGSVSAQAKTFIDRCQPHWVKTYLKKVKREKPGRGIFLACGAWEKDTFFKTARVSVDIFFKSLGVEFSDELFCGGVEKAGDINNNKQKLEEAYKLGERSKVR